MNTSQDQDLQHNNTIYNQKYSEDEASLAFYDVHAQQGDADEDRMDLDQAHMQADSAYHNQVDINGLEVGKKFYTAEDSYGDNSYLDSLLPHWNSESGVNFNSPSASHLFGYHLSDIRKQPSDQEDYGYQLQAQGQPDGNRAPYTANSNSSSSFAYNSEALKDGPVSHSSMPLRVDFSTFHDQMRQYQQAAIASQNSDSSTAPYIQQSSRSEASLRAQSTQARITRVSVDDTTTPSLRHSSASSKESSAGIGHEDRRWLNWVEQASQKQEFDATANENPTNAYFARHLVNFSRMLWEASDISRENCISVEPSQGKPPAAHQHLPAGDLQSNPYSSSSSAPVGHHQGYPAFQLASTIPERSTSRKHLADVNNPKVTDVSATHEEVTDLQQYLDHPSHQHISPQSQAYVGEPEPLFSNNKFTIGTSAKSTAPDWSQASRQRLRTIAPIQIPKASSRSSRDSDGAQTSLCTPSSSTGPFHSPVDAVSSSGPPPQSLKRKGSTASSIHEAASQSTSGKGSYECNICGRKFSRPSALVVHERVHSGEQPYLCEVCNRAFTVASNLRRHQKTHTQQLEQTVPHSQFDETIRASTVKQKTRRRNRDHGHADNEGGSQESDQSKEDE